MFLPDYKFFLNSEDRHDSLLSLSKSRAHGGTLVLWKKELDPFITVLAPETSRILTVIIEKPGYQTSAHITVYLTTSGSSKDAQFIRDLAQLQETIEYVSEKYPDILIYIRGDANASVKPRPDNVRDKLFNYFISENSLIPTIIHHKTYHHFLNNGLSDSNIDVLLSSNNNSCGPPTHATETLLNVLCGKTNYLVDSSHDVLVSLTIVPAQPSKIPNMEKIKAPRIEHSKHKVVWSDEGILEYQNLLAQVLPQIASNYVDSPEAGSSSVFFQTTTHILTSAAKLTNKVIELGKPPKTKKTVVPPEIKIAMSQKSKAHELLLTAVKNGAATEEVMLAKHKFKEAKSNLQNLVRKDRVSREVARDSFLNKILTDQPKDIFKAVKANKPKISEVKKLVVGNKVYTDDDVADGFFDNISNLKTIDKITATSYDSFAEDHKHIIEICRAGHQIPRISFSDAKQLLQKMRPHVSDFYSITAAHFLYGGDCGITHFMVMLNKLFSNIELASVEELNNVHAIILHKAHGKDRSLASSYRTISSCPFLSKAADVYLGGLSKDDWSACQADTQFQGEGMPHELASLLLTTVIQDSKMAKKPLFILLLDAKSAFDLVLRKILIRRLYLDTEPDQRIRFWDLRLASRTTFCQWGDQLMGPINDQLGVEQGGPNSSEFYKIYNNEQLDSAQLSGLGAIVEDEEIAAIGQADDTVLVSHDIFQLQHLLQLTLSYCEKYQVQLSATKTKLLVFDKDNTDYVKYVTCVNPIQIGDQKIEFASDAEHVGTIRSPSGNLPHILQRLVSHKKTLGAILNMGLSRRHRANPLACIRAETIYAIPVLFSGLASLVLNKTEVDAIALHVKETLQNLLKLHSATPDPVVFFLAGVLPGEATLHLKQLTLFGMISRLPNNIIYRIALQKLTSAPQSEKNWFSLIRELCCKYDLPHPITLLTQPQTKNQFKSLIKSKITDYWQSNMRARAAELKSLRYFKPEYMSLLRPHPMWSVATDSYSVNKSVTVARMLSGRYRCGSLTRHFSPANTGLCELCSEEVESLEHILVPKCPVLSRKKESLIEYARNLLANNKTASEIFELYIESKNEEAFVQFILDPTVCPEVISAKSNNIHEPLLRISATWCHSMHKIRSIRN